MVTASRRTVRTALGDLLVCQRTQLVRRMVTVSVRNNRNRWIGVILIVLLMGYYQRWMWLLVPYTWVAPFWTTHHVKQLGGPGSSSMSLSSVVPPPRHIGDGRDNNVGDDFGQVGGTLDSNSVWVAREAGENVQAQLDLSQNPEFTTWDSCQGPKVSCGSPVECGVGCQVHHVMTCLLLAYTYNRSLHLTMDRWPYASPWTDLFLPIGTSCPDDNDTLFASWNHGRTLTLVNKEGEVIHRLPPGLPMPLTIASSIRHLPTQPSLWWMGQFARFAMRLTNVHMGRLESTMSKLKLDENQPIVGILLGRSGRLGEKRTKSVSLDSAMTMAAKFFRNLDKKPNNNGTLVFPFSSVKRRVLLATDDGNVLKLARKRYSPKWTILGLTRKWEVDDVIRDVFILTQCTLVICSFSSDICRLVMELIESTGPGSYTRVRSMDIPTYFYDAPGFGQLRLVHDNESPNSFH